MCTWLLLVFIITTFIKLKFFFGARPSEATILLVGDGLLEGCGEGHGTSSASTLAEAGGILWVLIGCLLDALFGWVALMLREGGS
jgi:hypothetical protein